MEKQANNLPKKSVLKTFTKLLLFTLFFIVTTKSNAQVQGGAKYLIKDISVTGNTNFSPQTIIAYSKLRKDEEIQVGGEKIANAIKTLWKSNLFSSIDIYITNIKGNTANLEIKLVDLPELLDLTIEGVKKNKRDEIISENKLQTGVKVTENLIATTRNYLTNKYREKGFLNTKVKINTIKVIDSFEKERVNMKIAIDRGEKVKIKAINFEGNEDIEDESLEMAMDQVGMSKGRIFNEHNLDRLELELRCLLDIVLPSLSILKTPMIERLHRGFASATSADSRKARS